MIVPTKTFRMETVEILTRLSKVIVDTIGLSPSEITPQSHFINDLGVDSLMLSELIMLFEDEFGIRISDQDAANIRTVQQAVDYIREVLQKKEIKSEHWRLQMQEEFYTCNEGV